MGRRTLVEHWNVGLLPRTPGALPPPTTAGAVWLQGPPPGTFWADPFVLSHDEDGVELLVEECPQTHEAGRIVRVRADAAGRVWAADPVIAPRGHRSFPFVLEGAPDGVRRVLPESAREGTWMAWRAADDGTWQVEREVMRAPLVDGVLWGEGDRWWCLGGRLDDRDQARLFAWHAPSWSGPWTPLGAGPVKDDPAGARAAGALWRDAEGLWRPAQDCSARYGGGVVLHRVTRLDVGGFAEHAVARVAPDPLGPYPHGCHTLAPAGRWWVVDGVRDEHRLGMAWRRLARRVRGG